MESATQSVILVASDLMLSSSVSGYASAAGVTFRNVASITDAVAEINACERCLLLLDVGLPGLDFASIAENISSTVRQHAVAYGPHVHTEKLDAARNAGIATVMSRGQFSAQIQQMIAEFAAADSV